MNTSLIIIVSFGVAVLFCLLIYLFITVFYAIKHTKNGNTIFNDRAQRNEYNEWLNKNFLGIIYYSYSIHFYFIIIIILSVLEITQCKTLIIIALLVKAIISSCYIEKFRQKQNNDEKRIKELEVEIKHKNDIFKTYDKWFNNSNKFSEDSNKNEK